MSLNLNYDSISALCPNTRQVMVYGYGNTRYLEIAKTLRQDDNSPFSKVFNHSLGKPQMNMSASKTLEGSHIEQLRLEAFPRGISPEIANRTQCKREGKAALSNLVFENYKRKEEGLPSIPVLFCMESSDSKRTPSAKGILDRSEASSSLITHSELRRAYKLCHDTSVDPKVREAARETFIFVRVLRDTISGEYSLSKIDAPWEMASWSTEWDNRRKTSQYHEKEFPWRRQLNTMTNAFKNNNLANPSLVESRQSVYQCMPEGPGARSTGRDAIMTEESPTIGGIPEPSIGEEGIAGKKIRGPSASTSITSSLFKAFFKMVGSSERSTPQCVIRDTYCPLSRY